MCNYKEIFSFSELKCSGIYLIRDRHNRNVYVGRAKKFLKRFNEHFNKLEKQSHHCLGLQNVFNKYGKENLVVEIIESYESCEKDFLVKREQYYIDLFNQDKSRSFLNSSLKAEGGCGSISEKRKKEMSIKYSGKGNPNYGKTHSEEIRKEIGKLLKKSYETNKQKHLDRFKLLKEQGAYHKGALKAWENPSHLQLENLNKLIEKQKNLSKEELEEKTEKFRKTILRNKGAYFLYYKKKLIGIALSQGEFAKYFGVSHVIISKRLKDNNFYRDYTVKLNKNFDYSLLDEYKLVGNDFNAKKYNCKAKNIYKFDLLGNLICCYNNITDAIEDNNIPYHSQISIALNNNFKRVGLFMYSEISNSKPYCTLNVKTIYEYNLNNQLVNLFLSYKSFADKYSITIKEAKNIINNNLIFNNHKYYDTLLEKS